MCMYATKRWLSNVTPELGIGIKLESWQDCNTRVLYFLSDFRLLKEGVEEEPVANQSKCDFLLTFKTIGDVPQTFHESMNPQQCFL